MGGWKVWARNGSTATTERVCPCNTEREREGGVKLVRKPVQMCSMNICYLVKLKVPYKENTSVIAHSVTLLFTDYDTR